MAASLGRRRFLAITGAAAWGWAAGTHAQQPANMPKVGVLWHAGNAEEEGVYLLAFLAGMHRMGYVEDQNIRLINTFAAEQYERFKSNAAQLVAERADVLVAVTLPAALAAQRATKTIPIVFVVVGNPVEAGLVNSLSRPGGNITGLSHLGLGISAKRIELIKNVVPSLKHTALLVNPKNVRFTETVIHESQSAGLASNLKITPIEIARPEDVETAFARMAKEGIDSVVATNDPLQQNERHRIFALALNYRLPTMAVNEQMAEAGALMSYGADNLEIFRRTFVFVDKILRGARPSDLPVEQPTKFDLVINLKTAEALRLEVSPLIIARATKLLE